MVDRIAEPEERAAVLEKGRERDGPVSRPTTVTSEAAQ